MRFGWLIALILVVAVAAAIWYRMRAQGRTPAWVAHTTVLRRLPSFVRAKRLTRIAVAGTAAALTVSLVALAILAGAPVDRRVENPTLASRDLVLCLDASGSMLPYDGAILDQMIQMSSQFDGERLSLQMWSGQSVVKFPLTDDYQLIHDVLTEAAGVIDSGYMGREGDYVLVSPELADYLEGVDVPDGVEISSLVGDGLASCVLGFDHLDQERSRTVILATDNEVMGPQIYSLQQAVQFASEQDVRVIALYPATAGVLTTEGEDLQRVVEAAGGVFFKADDPQAIDGIIADIQSQQLAETAGEIQVIETDRPRTPLLWAMWAALIGLAFLGWRRL